MRASHAHILLSDKMHVSEQSQRVTTDARWQAELERNVYLLRHLANMYHCFGLSKHATTIDRTAQRVEQRIQLISSELNTQNDSKSIPIE